MSLDEVIRCLGINFLLMGYLVCATLVHIAINSSKILKELEKMNKNKQDGDEVKEWISVNDKLPERKTAHWVFGNTMGHSWMKCSECCVSQSGQTGCWTYCPNCGAEMKGKTEVETD